MRRTFGDRLLEMPDVTRYMLKYLDDEDLFNVCEIDPRFMALCNDQFWIRKIQQTYGLDLSMIKNMVTKHTRDGSYKTYYKSLRDYTKRFSDNNTLLAFGAENGRPDLIQIALDQGSDPEYYDHYALNYAVKYPEVWKLILERIPRDRWRRIHNYVLQTAVDYNNIEFIKTLVEAGRVLENNLLGQAVDKRNANTDLIKVLLDSGIPADADGSEALATAHGLETIKLLVERGADHHARQDLVFRYAVRYHDIDSIKYLLSLGINRQNLLDVIYHIEAFEEELKPLLPLLEEALRDAQ